MSRSVDSRDASDVSSSVSSNKAEEEPKLTADVKRITESIEGIMRQLIANARDDEEILFEVAIDSQPPANPPTKAPPKEKKKKLVPDPKEYFVSGFFHPTPKVPRAYQFTRVVHAKNVKSPVTDASMSETSMNPCGKKSEKRSKHLESMTATVYSDAPEDSYTSSKCGTNEKSSFSSLKNSIRSKLRGASYSSEHIYELQPSTSKLFPKARIYVRSTSPGVHNNSAERMYKLRMFSGSSEPRR